MISNEKKTESPMKLVALLLLLIFIELGYAQTYSVGHMSVNFKDSSRTGGYAISGGIAITGTGRDIGAEIYYPATVAGDNQPVALGQFPVVVFGHGFVMSWDAYDNVYNQLASKGYIVLLPRTEGGFSPSHTDFGKDLAFLVNAAQGLNTISTPTALATFNGKITSKAAIGGHSMGGGCSFLATAGNTSVTCLFNFAPATTNPSSITSASLVTVPTLIVSGARDCVADTTVQNSHYTALASAIKFHVILNQLTHCDFGNGTNTNCVLGESSSGCSNVVSNTLAFPMYMNYVQNFLDNQLKNDCAAGQRFMDTVNTTSSLRAGLKKLGSIACGATSLSETITTQQISVYPNPAQTKVYVNAAFKNYTLDICDVNGRKIYSKYVESQEQQIDLEDFEAGIYFIQIKSKDFNKSFKLVKY